MKKRKQEWVRTRGEVGGPGSEVDDPIPEGPIEVPTDPVIPDTGVVVQPPTISKDARIANAGQMVGQFLGRHPVENILRMRVQMGNEYGENRGWHHVTFPQEMLNAHVVAVSGPRSAKVPAIQLRTDIRSKYIEAFSQGIFNLIVKPVEDAIPNIIIIRESMHGFVDYIMEPLVSGVSKIYGSLMYDLVMKPLTDMMEELIRYSVPYDLPDAWGLDRGRSVHNVEITEINTIGFSWYSYSEHYINWIAIGMSPEEEVELPPEISTPMDELKAKIEELQLQYDDKLQQLEQWIQDLVAQIGGELPAVEGKGLLERMRRF